MAVETGAKDHSYYQEMNWQESVICRDSSCSGCRRDDTDTQVPSGGPGELRELRAVPDPLGMAEKVNFMRVKRVAPTPTRGAWQTE